MVKKQVRISDMNTKQLREKTMKKFVLVFMLGLGFIGCNMAAAEDKEAFVDKGGKPFKKEVISAFKNIKAMQTKLNNNASEVGVEFKNAVETVLTQEYSETELITAGLLCYFMAGDIVSNRDYTAIMKAFGSDKELKRVWNKCRFVLREYTDHPESFHYTQRAVELFISKR